jgi:hypothetical protein
MWSQASRRAMCAAGSDEFGILGRVVITNLLDVGDIVQRDVQITEAFRMQVFELMELVAMVHPFDGLFKSNCDKQAEGNGSDVDEEVSPAIGGVVGRVYVEHGVVLLGR